MSKGQCFSCHVSSKLESPKFHPFSKIIKQDGSFGRNTLKIEINGLKDKTDGKEDNRNEEPGAEVKTSNIIFSLKVNTEKKRNKSM